VKRLEDGPVPTQGDDHVARAHLAGRRQPGLLTRLELNQLEAPVGRPALHRLDRVQYPAGGMYDESNPFHTDGGYGSQILTRPSVMSQCAAVCSDSACSPR